LFVGGVHGDEPESVVFLSAALRSVKRGDLSPYVIPCINPDGLMMGTRANGEGVDINRNFPSSNWRFGEVNYSWSSRERHKVPLSSGRCAGSEYETAALLKFINKFSIRRIVAVHSPLNFVECSEHDFIGKSLAADLRIPIAKDVHHMAGSLSSWCVESNVEVVTIELPSVSIDSVISDYSDSLIPYLDGRVQI